MMDEPQGNQKLRLGSIQINVNQPITANERSWSKMSKTQWATPTRLSRIGSMLPYFRGCNDNAQPRHGPHRRALGSGAMDDCICTCAIQDLSKARLQYGASRWLIIGSGAFALPSRSTGPNTEDFAATRSFSSIFSCGLPFL